MVILTKIQENLTCQTYPQNWDLASTMAHWDRLKSQQPQIFEF